ncbi:U5 small nuclear ribonucleoprotein 200 kDa helicase-like protein [Trifolium pratense]|uniref:U5 small nuclear ribonucleoprotein 200 kDa helicase-like protein n=1 Tax=Trifolium pratense TaxID=57577 RepID=A0A2K3P8T9_TRIPR|nr:U5 small nuclear ribonucleoprotein 200 kDa helicase-like protein [Trifolium pratense]
MMKGEEDGGKAAKSGVRPPKKKCKEEELSFPPAAIDEGIYHPTTDETRAAYDEMFSIIQKSIAGNPLSTVRDINLILNLIPDNVFDRLVSIAKLLTDFQAPDLSAYRHVPIIDIPPLENHIFK